MAETRFPNGLDVDSGHAGNVPAYVTADGARLAAGTAILSNAGTVDVTTGLTTVLFAQATPYGPPSAAGTAGGYASVNVEVKSAGVLLLRGVDQMGTASTASGTASWFAIGT